MSRKLAASLLACLLLFSKSAWAHRIDEYLQATILSLGANTAHASMRLVPGVIVAPSVIAAIDTNHDGIFSEPEKQAYAARVLSDLSISIDAQPAIPHLDSWFFPEPSQLRQGLGEILIEYHVDLPPGSQNRTLILANHHLNANSVYLMNAEVPHDPILRIQAQKRNELQSIYELDYQQLAATNASATSPTTGLQQWLSGLQLSPLFHLGMRHIEEGTDHLLFLLVLLLPAPLLARHHRWGPAVSVRKSLLHILGIVTAFTLGHSITLSLAAMSLVHLPSRPVEVLIAVSILVSAIHALRPIFPGREAWIAAFFGLIHGLAFAATLNRLGLSRWDRLAGILAFNLGIENMQLAIVAVLLPSLLLMSRTRVYSIIRIFGALFATAASTAWIIERLFEIQTPADAIVNVIAHHGLLAALTFFLASLTCKIHLAATPASTDSARTQPSRRRKPLANATRKFRPQPPS